VMLIGAGMAGQASLLLIQADWLPSQAPLWDSSNLVAENSITGQLLYALIGYEATPTPIQAIAYFGGLILPLVLMLITRQGSSPDA
jgi:high-affinity iron transporter